MKKTITHCLLASAVIVTISCNNNDNKSPEAPSSSQRQSDSGGKNDRSIDPSTVDTIQTPRQIDSIQNK